MRLDKVIGPQTIQKILQALDHSLSIDDNLLAKRIGPITTPAADTEFVVTHNLGRVPNTYTVNIDRAAIVYDSRRASWTDTQMFLKCNVSVATIYLIVM